MRTRRRASARRTSAPKSSEAQLKASAEREHALSEHLRQRQAELEAGAEALGILEERSTDAEARAREYGENLQLVQSRLDEAAAARERATAREVRLQAALTATEEKLRVQERDERARREQHGAQVKRDSAARIAQLEDELRQSNNNAADLNHRLTRLSRDREKLDPRSGLALGSALAVTGGGSPHGGRADINGTRAMEELSGRLAAAERERDASTRSCDRRRR